MVKQNGGGRSPISDEELARVIEEDKRLHPEAYLSTGVIEWKEVD